MASISNPLALTLALAAVGSPNLPKELDTFLSPGSLSEVIQQNSFQSDANASDKSGQQSAPQQMSQWFNGNFFNSCYNYNWRRC